MGTCYVVVVVVVWIGMSGRPGCMGSVRCSRAQLHVVVQSFTSTGSAMLAQARLLVVSWLCTHARALVAWAVPCVYKHDCLWLCSHARAVADHRQCRAFTSMTAHGLVVLHKKWLAQQHKQCWACLSNTSTTASGRAHSVLLVLLSVDQPCPTYG